MLLRLNSIQFNNYIQFQINFDIMLNNMIYMKYCYLKQNSRCKFNHKSSIQLWLPNYSNIYIIQRHKSNNIKDFPLLYKLNNLYHILNITLPSLICIRFDIEHKQSYSAEKRMWHNSHHNFHMILVLKELLLSNKTSIQIYFQQNYKLHRLDGKHYNFLLVADILNNQLYKHI